MPKYVAIDWNPSEVRYLVADFSRGGLQVLRAGMLNTSTSSEGEDRSESVAELLADRIGRAGGTRAVGMMTVGRGAMDTYRLTLPPATDDELAALVHTQVIGQVGASMANSVIDFSAPPTDPAESRPVEAVVAHPETITRYQALASSAGTRLKRLVLRPHATAALWHRLAPERLEETVLIVSILGNEVDLILTDANRISFWRTIQLPEELRMARPAGTGSADRTEPVAQAPDIPQDPNARILPRENLDPLLLEINRTLAVAPTELAAGQSVQGIVLFGSQAECRSITSMLEDQTEIPIQTADLTQAPGLSWAVTESNRAQTEALAPDASLIETVPEPGRVAPLLGMLLDEAAGVRPAIDLLHPRQLPKPYNRRRLWILTAVAALVFFMVGQSVVSGLKEDAKNQSLNYYRQLKQLQRTEQKFTSDVAVEQALRNWAQGNIVWLDELRDLSAKFPPAQDILVRSMTISPRRGGGAVIRIQGLVRDPSVVGRMDLDLRIEGVRIATSTNYREQPGEGATALDWRFETQILTQRRPVSAYRQDRTNPPRTAAKPAL